MAAPQQLDFGFDDKPEGQTISDFPATMEDAISYYRALVGRHHAAMMMGDEQTARSLREEARALATRLNGGEPGILAGPTSPGCVLDRVTAAEPGEVPLWGQAGDFTVALGSMRVRIEQDGIFGIGASVAPYPGFAAHAIDYDKPFLSETGYRSFLGLHAEVVPGMTPDIFAKRVLSAYLQNECKGKPKRIGRSYVESEMARRTATSGTNESRGHSGRPIR